MVVGTVHYLAEIITVWGPKKCAAKGLLHNNVASLVSSAPQVVENNIF